jgi:hypothetical protein
MSETDGKITTFAEFQTSNIKAFGDEIVGMSAEEALAHLQKITDRFDYEIWERKEKSWAAETLKNQIRKTVESEKRKILPDYDPKKLSAPSKTKHKTEAEETKDKTIKMFQKMGISASDAESLIKKTLAQTYEIASAKLEPAKVSFKVCPKCKGYNPLANDKCMICKTALLTCEACPNVVSELHKVGDINMCSECKAKNEAKS